MPNPHPVGNRTERRGRKLRRAITLDDAAREKLRRIWRARSIQEPGLTEDAIVCEAILALAEPNAPDAEAWDGGVL